MKKRKTVALEKKSSHNTGDEENLAAERTIAVFQ
jgi:hypothetical protein